VAGRERADVDAGAGAGRDAFSLSAKSVRSYAALTVA
jgi:hypothetical protein